MIVYFWKIMILLLQGDGRNLLLNKADHHFTVVGLDLDAQKVQALEKEANENHKIKSITAIQNFVDALRKPRAIYAAVTCR